MRVLSFSCFIFIFHNLATIIPEAESTDAKTLAIQWAPRVRFHPNEKYYPMSIQDFLSKTDCAKEDEEPVETLPTGPESAPYFLSTKSDKERLIRNLTSFLHGTNPEKGSVPMYAAITKCGSTDDHFIITYFAFYGFNLGQELCSVRIWGMTNGIPFPPVLDGCLIFRKRYFNNHIGDFETVTLEIKNGAPERMVLSAHTLGVEYKYNGEKFVLVNSPKTDVLHIHYSAKAIVLKDGHPVLYAAKGSHPFYGRKGTFDFSTHPLPGLLDRTGTGSTWETWNNLKVFFTNEGAPDWYNFEGKWGNPKEECTGKLAMIGIPEVCLYLDGPTGLKKRELDIKCDA